jgi:hypothetical protein
MAAILIVVEQRFDNEARTRKFPIEPPTGHSVDEGNWLADRNMQGSRRPGAAT